MDRKRKAEAEPEEYEKCLKKLEVSYEEYKVKLNKETCKIQDFLKEIDIQIIKKYGNVTRDLIIFLTFQKEIKVEFLNVNYLAYRLKNSGLGNTKFIENLEKLLLELKK